MSALLTVRGLKTSYGKIAALKGVDIDVADGEIVTLIGANGAGKSTLMMTIFGKPRAREGAIVFDGQDISKLPTHEIARLRIAQSPEGRRIFSRMTVLENLQMGAVVAPICKFSSTVMREKMRRPSGACASLSRAISWVGVCVMSWPANVIEPSRARGLPQTVIISVDLPAPLAPISATISPALMSRSTPLIASILP